MTEPTEPLSDSAEGRQSASEGWLPADGRELLTRLRHAVYVLGSLLATSLLVIGTVAIIAEIKGTWHWAIHLESTISYMAVAIAGILVLLVPLAVALVVGRWWIDA